MVLGSRPPAEVEVGEPLVRALLREQQPDLAALPLEHVSSGWDNEVLRLGDTLALRLPRRAAGVPLLEHELRWLPVLAPALPLPVPVPVRAGRPGAGYPWPWAVVRWLPGDIAADAPFSHPGQAARTLGAFVRELGRPAPPDAPHNPARGVPLVDRDPNVRGRLERWGSRSPVDSRAVLERWEQSLAAPRWSGPPTWIHGDLHPANLLVTDGRPTAVIDFGDLASGDPATDLSVAWMLFEPEEREVFREAAGRPDDATWVRARGNALAHAMACLDSSADHAVMAAIARRTLQAVLSDPD